MGSYQQIMDAAAVAAFLDTAFPKDTRPVYGRVSTVAPGYAEMRLDPTEAMLRPGRRVSGPTLMGLADVVAYAVVIAHVGPVAMAVTNTLTMNFLRACEMRMIVAEARLLKLGRRLAVVDVRIWQDSEDRPVAQATVGYALP
ncbi:PaaI family thioesterase [Sphingomonas floccifaciens]|uniref:PaaI family thioesterase n=1 Tax=Sphingomonas floccifaciens TaxID=1844115 RepID=A0ABW4NGY1_9SPHN